MIAKVQIKIPAAKNKFESPRKRFDVQKLQNQEFKQNFQLSLRNKYEQLGSLENEDIENHWSMVKHVVLGTAEEVLGFKNSRRKEWMTEETWEKVAERRKVKEEFISSKTRRQKAELQAVYREKDHPRSGDGSGTRYDRKKT
jgi:hypothetical protein